MVTIAPEFRMSQKEAMFEYMLLPKEPKNLRRLYELTAILGNTWLFGDLEKKHGPALNVVFDIEIKSLSNMTRTSTVLLNALLYEKFDYVEWFINRYDLNALHFITKGKWYIKKLADKYCHVSLKWLAQRFARKENDWGVHLTVNEIKCAAVNRMLYNVGDGYLTPSMADNVARDWLLHYIEGRLVE